MMGSSKNKQTKLANGPAPIARVTITQSGEVLSLPVLGHTRLYDGRRDRLEFSHTKATEFSAGWLVKVERFANGEARGWYKTAYSGVGSRGLWPISVSVSCSLLDELPICAATLTVQQLAQELLSVLDTGAREDLERPAEAWVGLENGAGIEIGTRIEALITLARTVLTHQP